MTKSELINKACKNADINCVEFTQGFNQMIEVIKETISSGEPIFIRGFGTLKSVERKAKVARNISKGESITIPQRNVPVFKPSREFKEQVEYFQN